MSAQFEEEEQEQERSRQVCYKSWGEKKVLIIYKHLLVPQWFGSLNTGFSGALLYGGYLR